MIWNRRGNRGKAGRGTDLLDRAPGLARQRHCGRIVGQPESGHERNPDGCGELRFEQPEPRGRDRRLWPG
jgi:hypothetical protein